MARAAARVAPPASSAEPAGAPARLRSRLACFNVLSSSAGPESGFCSLEAASELFPPRIGSGGLGKALPGPQAHPLPLGQRTKPPCRGRPPPPQLPRTLACPKHRLPFSVRVVLLSIGCALQNSSQMIFPAGLWFGTLAGERKRKNEKRKKKKLSTVQNLVNGGRRKAG